LNGRPYGISLKGLSNAAEGYYSPVKLQTRVSNLDTEAGPIIDTNDAFDSVFVTPPPLKTTLEVKKITQNKSKPTDSYYADFTISFPTWTD